LILDAVDGTLVYPVDGGGVSDEIDFADLVLLEVRFIGDATKNCLVLILGPVGELVVAHNEGGLGGVVLDNFGVIVGKLT